MAFTISRERIAPVMVKKETAYGTEPTPAPAPGTDDLLTINAPNTFAADISTFELRPHGSTFTRGLDLIGAQVARRTVSFLLAGSASAGVHVNGSSAQAALLMACGLKETVATSTSFTYAPATVAQIKTFSDTTPRSGSCTIWGDHDGVTHKTSGCWGNMVMSGNPTGGLLCEFTGLGIYQAPVATSTLFANFTGGTNRAKPFYNVTGTIGVAGAYSGTNFVFKSFRFDMGVDVQRVMSCNATTGLHSLLFADRNPTLDVVLALDTDGSAGLTYPNIYANLIASATHAVGFVVNGGTGNTITFSFPTVQLRNATLGVDAGHRTVTLNYKVQHATPETEFSIAIT